MSLPANIRINTSASFPSQVKGSGLVRVTKKSGIWTISLDFSQVQLQNASPPDPAHTYLFAYNSLTQSYALILLGRAVLSKNTTILTGVAPYTSPYAAQPDDEVLIIKQAAGAPFTVTVDWSTRFKPLRVVDGKGDAAVNNITIAPALGQTQMAQVNYSYVIDGNGGSIILTPLPDGSGAY